jgi:hypothetical protein
MGAISKAKPGPISLASGGSDAGAGVKPVKPAAKSNWFRSLWGKGGGAGAEPYPKGVISISPEDDENAPSFLDDEDAGAASGPIFLDNEDPKHLRNMQLYGVDAANRMKFGGGQQGQYGGGQQGQENNFWSSPSPANSRRITADMYSRFLGFNSPVEYSGWREAQTSGLGRALKARGDNQFVRMMLGNM